MVSHLQKTLEEIIEFKGVGLHSGVDVNLCLKPAEPNSGIRFKRTDIDDSKNIIEIHDKNYTSKKILTIISIFILIYLIYI